MSHVHTYAFHTTDPMLAQKITALIASGGHSAVLAPVQVAPPALPAAPIAPPAAPVAPPAPPPAPVAPPAPPAAPVAPPAPPAAPPAAPAAAAGPLVLDAQDQATIGMGWTLDMMKAAATAYTGKMGAAGPAGMKKILGDHGATRLANGIVVGANCLAPKHYPAVHQLLSA